MSRKNAGGKRAVMKHGRKRSGGSESGDGDAKKPRHKERATDGAGFQSARNWPWIAAVFIATSVVLIIPRDKGFTLLDGLDGTVCPVLLVLVYRSCLSRDDTSGIYWSCLELLRAAGHGMHAIANSTDFYNGFVLTPLGKHIYFCHETVSHTLVYYSDALMLLHFIYEDGRSASQPVPFWLYIIALLHGEALAMFAIGTRTVPAYALVVLYVAMFRPRSRYSVALSVCICSTFLYWFATHGGFPTFDDLSGDYTVPEDSL